MYVISHQVNIAGEASSGQMWRAQQNINPVVGVWCFLNIFPEVLKDIICSCYIAGEARSEQIWRAPQNMYKYFCNILQWCFLNNFQKY